MLNYKGNAICDYVAKNKLDYFFSAKDNWVLVYGDSNSIPKILVFACKVDNFKKVSEEEKTNADVALRLAEQLKLPFITVRFMNQSNSVCVWESLKRSWKSISYDELRDIYERYGVVRPGTPKKPVNQYTSSPYHDWQRQNLGAITVSDFDLLKFKNNQVKEIIELKRSKVNIKSWNPYPNDFPNFALLINSIINSGTHIPFTLYYNKMEEGPKGGRVEDLSKIKVFTFVIPDKMINSSQVSYNYEDKFSVDELLS